MPPEQCASQHRLAAFQRQQLEVVDFHGHRRQFHRHVLAGQLVGAHAVHFLGGDRRRRLQELAAERFQAALQLFPVDLRLGVRATWGRPRGRRCRWRSRSAPRPRRSCRCAYRTAPGAWPGRPPAAARRWRWGRACPGAPPAWYRPSRRNFPTTSCEVHPCGLSTMIAPSTQRCPSSRSSTSHAARRPPLRSCGRSVCPWCRRRCASSLYRNR